MNGDPWFRELASLMAGAATPEGDAYTHATIVNDDPDFPEVEMIVHASTGERVVVTFSGSPEQMAKLATLLSTHPGTHGPESRGDSGAS